MSSNIGLVDFFAHSNNVFVCDFVVALEMCDGKIYSLYGDKGTSFKFDKLHAFRDLFECTHESTHLKWVDDGQIDLNGIGASVNFAFVVG